ncbi:MAG: leucine-rich repeat domain-containing protein, partial [Culicoidibacterales bacterium]
MTHEQIKDKPLFIDKNLMATIESALNNQNLRFDQNSLEQLQTLNISNANISALDGIELCKNLRFLAASQNQLTSLNPLEALENLEVVSVWGNQLTSLAVLEKLPNLKQVYAFDNPLEEYSASELLVMSFFKTQPIENREFAQVDLVEIVEKQQEVEAERQRLEAEQAAEAEAERQRLEAEQEVEVERDVYKKATITIPQDLMDSISEYAKTQKNFITHEQITDEIQAFPDVDPLDVMTYLINSKINAVESLEDTIDAEELEAVEVDAD